MNVVGYGGGTNSTAMLIGLWQRRIPVDLILFADPGGEQPHTYAYLEIMGRWLAEHGMPPITRVWYTTRAGRRLTLEQECLRSASLPSIAYGHKKCSLKHKAFPQEKFCRHDPRCRAVWAGGGRVIKFIGYDAGEPERRERVSSNFGQLLRHTGMPHMRFHDLRHSAATNMHQLTGDFYTVGMILGHSLKGIGIQLGISNNLESVTAQYVDVRLDRKQVVLDTYHRAVLSGTNV